MYRETNYNMINIDSDTLKQQVQVVNGVAQINKNGTSREITTKELPEQFVRWQLDYKHNIYDAIEKDEYIAIDSHGPCADCLNTNPSTWFKRCTPTHTVFGYTTSKTKHPSGVIQEKEAITRSTKAMVRSTLRL